MEQERPNICQHTAIRMDANGEYCGICGENLENKLISQIDEEMQEASKTRNR